MYFRKPYSPVSNISTESENIFLDASLRMGGILALTLWEFVTERKKMMENEDFD